MIKCILWCPCILFMLSCHSNNREIQKLGEDGDLIIGFLNDLKKENHNIDSIYKSFFFENKITKEDYKMIYLPQIHNLLINSNFEIYDYWEAKELFPEEVSLVIENLDKDIAVYVVKVASPTYPDISTIYICIYKSLIASTQPLVSNNILIGWK